MDLATLKCNSKAQLDHILINGKWLNSIRNVRAYNSVELNSDHRIVSAKILLSLRAPNNHKCKRIKYDWDKLKDDTDLQFQFNIEVTNRYEILSQHKLGNDIQTKYDNFIKAIEETATKVVGNLKRKNKNNWVSDDTINILKRRNKAKSVYKQNPKLENRKR